VEVGTSPTHKEYIEATTSGLFDEDKILIYAKKVEKRDKKLEEWFKSIRYTWKSFKNSDELKGLVKDRLRDLWEEKFKERGSMFRIPKIEDIIKKENIKIILIFVLVLVALYLLFLFISYDNCNNSCFTESCKTNCCKFSISGFSCINPLLVDEPRIMCSAGDIGKGRAVSKHEFLFTKNELCDDESCSECCSTIPIEIPITASTEIRDIYSFLDCDKTNGEREQLIYKINDDKTKYTSTDDLVDVDWLIRSWDSKVIMNTGKKGDNQLEGTKALSAEENAKMYVVYYFEIHDHNSPLEIECDAKIIVENPIFAENKKFTIIYTT